MSSSETNSSPVTKRLFIGTLLAAEQSQLLEKLQAEFNPLFQEWWKDCKLRWVKPEKLHITWLFLGDCDAARENAVLEALKAKLSGLQALSLQYEKLEIFGSKHRPNAMVLLPETITPELQTLGSVLRNELGQFCQRKGDLAFRPHLTLFRFPRDYRGKIAMKNQLDLSKYLPLQQEILNVSLIESHSGTQKEAYEIIADFKLLSNLSPKA